MLRITTPDETAVREAAFLLDVDRPRWAERVNIDTLDLFSAKCCILGQVYRYDRLVYRYGRLCGWALPAGHGYWRGLKRLQVFKRILGGELSPGVFSSNRYRAYWIQAIRARR